MSRVYQYVTDRIIKALEGGTIPWKKPWSGGRKMPSNLVSKKTYRGINVFLLSLFSRDSYFVSFKQAKAFGGTVKKGEKGHMVIFYKNYEKMTGAKNDQGKEITEKIPVLRYYNVFGLSQCEGIQAPQDPAEQLKDNEQIDRCETIVNQNSPKIITADYPFYAEETDEIGMPAMGKFENSPHYYATLFHELTHWTRHKTRLNRKDKEEPVKQPFGSASYAKEELVAEMGAAFLCAHCQIDTAPVRDNEVAYVQNWLKVLKSNSKLVVQVAAKAQKAADFILKKEETQ